MLASLNSKLYTVAVLKEIADRMGLEIKGKVTKPVLAGIIADAIDILHRDVLDTLHAEAISENALVNAKRTLAKNETSRIAAPKLAIKPSGPKTYTQRMINRCEGYARQNGHEYSGFIGDMIAKFTPKQRKRYNKKVKAFNAK